MTVPVIYVSLPDLSVAAASEKYTSAGPDAGRTITVKSPAGKVAVVVDGEGFVIDYPGLAERI